MGKNKVYRVSSFFLLVMGTLLVLNSQNGITGAVVGVSSIYSGAGFLLGIIFVLSSVFLFVIGVKLEERLEDIQDIADLHGWIEYAVNPKLEPVDKRVEKTSGKSTGLGYLNDEHSFPAPERTSMQKRIEKMVSGGRILSYVGREDKKLRNKNRGEVVNRRNTYEEQFHEPHAAGGGRVIDVESHISDGRLDHFNELADGRYIWSIDKEGNFVIGNRGEVDEQGNFVGITHDMYQVPKEFGSGERHEKVEKRKMCLPHPTLVKGSEVFGAGEVEINNGLISKFNADTGHYAKLETDIGGRHEPDNFVRQSIEVFRYFTHKAGWKEVPGGAEFDSKF